MQILGIILSIVGAVGGIWVLVDAFKTSVGQGLLTFCVPCYVFYFLFAVSQNPNKMIQFALILVGYIGGGINGYANSQAMQH